MKRIFTMLIIAILFLPLLKGQYPAKKQYTATKITTTPVIDGILDDEAWKEGSWAGGFTQNRPYNGSPASQSTEFKIVFDEDNIYVAIKANDTHPDSIVTRLTRRDETDGDIAGIFIDSYHDLRTAFLFAVSSSGVKFDEIMTNDGQNEDATWDANWWVATSKNNDGWVAEMKIPFSQIRFDKNSSDGWGFDVARVLFRKNEQSLWQHIPRDASGMVHLFAELKGMEQIKPRKIFDITPYTVAKTETYEKSSDNPFLASGKSSKINAGIDAKIGVTNNMTMDLTINPDFGQVEADPSVVNLSAYETFYTEKRPFFIEGNNITNFGLGIGNGSVGNDNLFYSRRIGRAPQVSPDLKDGWNIKSPIRTDIIGAAKLTGKNKDGFSVAVVEAVTAREKGTIDTIGGRKSTTVEPLTNYFVGRVQKDINNGNTIVGGIFTSTNRELDNDVRDLLHRSAYTGGVDFTQYFKNKNWMFNLNAAFSMVQGSKKAIESTQESSSHYFQRPDKNYARLDTNRTYLAGSGGRMEIQKLNGHWNFLGALLWKTPGFETNDLGYMRVSDQLFSVLWVGYNQFNPKWIYRNYNLNSDVYSIFDFGGNFTGMGYEYNASMNFKNFWSAYIGGNISSSNLSSDKLRGGPMMKLPGNVNFYGSFSSDSRKKFYVNVSSNYGKGFENSSNNYYGEVDITYKPINYLSFTFSPSYSKSYSDLQYVNELDYNDKSRYIFASIDQKTISASFRMSLNLSPNLTLQYWGQPFVASGKYHNYKYILDPRAKKYSDRYWSYNGDQMSYDTDHYNVDENGDGKTDYTIDDNNFNFQQFLSNLVLRWEYNPGSTVYLVWSQSRSYSTDTGQMDYFNNLGDLFSKSKNTPHNVFLIKFSYRFGLK